MRVSTPVVVTHPCSLFREGLRQTLAKSKFRAVHLLPELDDALRCYLRATDSCLWIFGVERFDSARELLMRQMNSSNQSIKAVILSVSQNSTDVVRALNAGACGFFGQDISAELLLRSLELIVSGQTVIYPQFGELSGEAANETSRLATNGACRLVVSGQERATASEPDPSQNETEDRIDRGLSARELAILRTLMDGASNKLIAKKLVITEATVKVHMKAILRKLRLQNRTQAAIWARNYLNESSSAEGWGVCPKPVGSHGA